MPAAIDKGANVQKEGKRIELVKDSPKQFVASGAAAAAVSAPASLDTRADISAVHVELPATQAEAPASSFNEEEAIHDLKHYLPSQAPLKDFIHHNTLHAFQSYTFHEGTRRAKKIFGYFPSLQLREYRDLYEAGRIRKDILERVISEQKGAQYLEDWMQRLLEKEYDDSVSPRIGKLRANWKRHYPIDLDLMVHPLLFRILCSYLDQGISVWGFPIGHKGFLAAMKEMEEKSFTSFFKTKRAKKLLVSGNHKMEDLLSLLVGDETLYAQYLFDQQFAHPGSHGEVYMIGAFIGYFVLIGLGGPEDLAVPVVVALTLMFLAAMLGSGLLGVLIERFAYRRLRNAPRIAPLITALGVAFFLQSSALLLFGAQFRSYGTFQFMSGGIEVAGVRISTTRILVVVATFALMVALTLLVGRTTLGKAMRATAYDREAAAMMGIDVDRVIVATFLIGSILAGAAGVMFGLVFFSVYHLMGFTAGLKGFTAAVVGGIGSIPGAMLGGLLIGLAEAFSAAYISSTFQDLIVFSILIAVMLFRPTGLLGKADIRKV